MIKTLLLVSTLQIPYRAHGDPINDINDISDINMKDDGNRNFGFDESNSQFSTAPRRLDDNLIATTFDLKHPHSAMIDHGARWGQPVRCKENHFAHGYRIRFGNSRLNPEGLTHITLYCQKYQHYQEGLDSDTSEAIESGVNLGSQLVKEECEGSPIRLDAMGNIITRRRRLDQFMVSAVAYIGEPRIGVISFHPICDMPDLSFWNTTASIWTASPGSNCQGEMTRAKDGKATAKTEWSPKTAEAAFRTHSRDHGLPSKWREWHSKRGMPQWLLYELKEPLPICKISFYPRIDNSGGNTPRDCPKSFRFEGSNDNDNFDTLLEYEDFDVDRNCKAEVKITLPIPEDRVKAYKFYRFFVVDVRGRTQSQGQKYAVFGNIRFFSINDIEKPVRKTLSLHYDKLMDFHKKHVGGSVYKVEKSCKTGEGICGINTRIHDTKGISRIRIFCCKVPKLETESPSVL